MAGNFPDVPGPMIHYDLDGSLVYRQDSTGAILEFTLAQAQNLNDYALTSYGFSASPGHTNSIGVVFPQQCNIVGVFFHAVFSSGTHTWNIDTSVDTTNGVDGTWVRRITSFPFAIATIPGYRASIVAVDYTGIKGIRLINTVGNSTNPTVYTLHLYGKLTNPVTDSPNRLRVWHPTLDQGLDDMSANDGGEPTDGAWLDWGNVPRNSSAEKTFRIKNQSATLTANNIVVSASTLTDTSPSVPAQISFKQGVDAYAATTMIASLAPGDISSIIMMKRTTSLTATLGLWTGRVIANPASWA